jgi:hypothetical protein
LELYLQILNRNFESKNTIGPKKIRNPKLKLIKKKC